MRLRIGRWGFRGALGLGALLVLAVGVGSLAQKTSNVTLDPSKGAPDAGLAERSGGGAAGTLPGSFTSADSFTSLKPGLPAAAPQLLEGAKAFDLPALPSRVVKTGDLTVEVKRGKFEEAWREASAVASRLGGYVVSSNRGSPSIVPVPLGKDVASDSREAASAAASPPFGDIIIRIPSAKFDSAMNALRGFGTIKGDQVSSQDVTQQFVDLEARLRNQRAHETALLRLMAKAQNVRDTLLVQDQLTQVRGEIEQITGTLRQLRSQSDQSTISLHLTEPGAAAAIHRSETGPSFAKAWTTMVEGLIRIGSALMIGAAWLAPFALMALAILAIRRGRRSVVQPQA